ncbi:hypothetical protein QBC43DRAFT_373168 [Cladorrhinum sp. PSN259]|nr:hypothetical protein QBC43DRAFT_373168 [Cladorrhinum sp. PSN259]
MPKSLPFEIKDMILSHITPANSSSSFLYLDEPGEVTWTPSEMRTLLFVDIQFRDKCLKTLYSSINITSPSMLVKLLKTPIKHPHLRPLVKTVYYSFPLEWQDPEWKAHSLWLDILSVLKELFFDVYDFRHGSGHGLEQDSGEVPRGHDAGAGHSERVLLGGLARARAESRDNFGETLISFARVDEGVRRRMGRLRLDEGEEPEVERGNEDDAGGVDWLECSVIFFLAAGSLLGSVAETKLQGLCPVVVRSGSVAAKRYGGRLYDSKEY